MIDVELRREVRMNWLNRIFKKQVKWESASGTSVPDAEMILKRQKAYVAAVEDLQNVWVPKKFKYAYIHDTCGCIVFYCTKKMKKDMEILSEDFVWSDGSPVLKYERQILGPSTYFNPIDLTEETHYPKCRRCGQPISIWPKLKE